MTVTDDETDGGDSPCWAHLFDDAVRPGDGREDNGQVAPATTGSGADVVDLPGLAWAETAPGAVWTHQSEDLNANLLVFASGGGVAEHVNAEVDVLLVGIAGEGVVDVDGTRRILRAGQALVIAKGARRGTRGLSERFAYLTCHRRRAGLRPSR